MFEICMVLALGDPPPGPLRMIPAKFGYNPAMRFQEVDETVTFYT